MKIKNLIAKIALVGLISWSMVPALTQAAEIEPRSLTLGSSAAGAVTTYSFSFKPGTSGNIGAIEFQICDTPVQTDPCNNTGASSGVSFTSHSASILSQSGISGFTAGAGSPPAPTANTFWITNGTPQNISTGTTVTVTLQNVLSPSASNTTFWSRVSTFSDSAGTVPVDFGGEAVSTANTVTVSGTMPESLVFCVGTSGTTCASGGSQITGNAVNLGTFSPTVTSTGTSVMDASTNASSGYAITVNGTTLTSGLNNIAAMGTQSLNSATCAPSCTSTTGVSQFGSNVVANTTPAVGANVTPTGAGYNGAASGGYASSNAFRFFSGDTVASSNNVSNGQLFTNSYIVNVGGSQAAGLYSSTLTYICTATF